MRPKPPCKDCFDRKLGCHGVCQRYKDWKGILAKEAEARQKELDSFGSLARNKELFRKVGMQR